MRGWRERDSCCCIQLLQGEEEWRACASLDRSEKGRSWTCRALPSNNNVLSPHWWMRLGNTSRSLTNQIRGLTLYYHIWSKIGLNPLLEGVAGCEIEIILSDTVYPSLLVRHSLLRQQHF